MDGSKNPDAKTERKTGNFLSLWSLCESAGFWDQNRFEPKKAKKFCFLWRAPFSFIEFWLGEAGACRARVLFVEVLFTPHIIALG